METKSPYLLIFRDASRDTYKAMSAEQRQKLMERWNAWYEGLVAEGKLDHGRPLEPEGRVVSGARGERVVDGPYSEAKEGIGGYFLLMVSSLDEATEIAQRCPNLAHGMVVEVRPVAETCPLLRSAKEPAALEMANA
jgi:hypothetical protein